MYLLKLNVWFFLFHLEWGVLLFTSAQCLSVRICQTTWESVDCFCWGFLKFVSMGWRWMKVTMGWTVPRFCSFRLCHWFGLGFLAYWFHFFTFTQLHTLGLNAILNLQREKEGKKNGERTNFLFLIVNFGHYSKILEWLGLALPIIQAFRLNTSLAAASLG